MDRWINIDFPNRMVLPETHATELEAFKAASDLERYTLRSAYNWEQIRIQVEVA